ncbi:uncharacterized protein LOC143689976 [Tamandua tetradactyla]|uniref:uncharacterized protein LOC143689976 n=1 Tax=Tamandua tetradactyla TaxID=48850 RepID=UPI004053CFB8
MDFSLGLRLGPRNKKAAHQQPPAPSRHSPLAVSPCISYPTSVCACPCPACPPPTCSCTACPSYAATCPSCPSLPGPPCICSCPPCPACPSLACPHTSCIPCTGLPLNSSYSSPCPIYRSKGQAACPSFRLGCGDSCSCGRGAAWASPASTGCCSCCFRGQRTSRGHCLIV